MNIRPLYDKLLVERCNNDKTEGGIYIPEDSREKSNIGKVISVGGGRLLPDGRLHPLQIKAGDTVFFNKFSGLDAGQENHIILREDEIIGIVEPN